MKDSSLNCDILQVLAVHRIRSTHSCVPYSTGALLNQQMFNKHWPGIICILPSSHSEALFIWVPRLPQALGIQRYIKRIFTVFFRIFNGFCMQGKHNLVGKADMERDSCCPRQVGHGKMCRGLAGTEWALRPQGQGGCQRRFSGYRSFASALFGD